MSLNSQTILEIPVHTPLEKWAAERQAKTHSAENPALPSLEEYYFKKEGGWRFTQIIGVLRFCTRSPKDDQIHLEIWLRGKNGNAKGVFTQPTKTYLYVYRGSKGAIKVWASKTIKKAMELYFPNGEINQQNCRWQIELINWQAIFNGKAISGMAKTEALAAIEQARKTDGDHFTLEDEEGNYPYWENSEPRRKFVKRIKGSFPELPTPVICELYNISGIQTRIDQLKLCKCKFAKHDLTTDQVKRVQAIGHYELAERPGSWVNIETKRLGTWPTPPLLLAYKRKYFVIEGHTRVANVQTYATQERHRAWVAMPPKNWRPGRGLKIP